MAKAAEQSPTTRTEFGADVRRPCTFLRAHDSLREQSAIRSVRARRRRPIEPRDVSRRLKPAEAWTFLSDGEPRDLVLGAGPEARRRERGRSSLSLMIVAI